MSKRKDIEYLHNITGLSYKECRAMYKEAKEDLYKTPPFKPLRDALETSFNSILPEITKALEIFRDTIIKVIDSIDWDSINEALDKIREGADND